MDIHLSHVVAAVYITLHHRLDGQQYQITERTSLH